MDEGMLIEEGETVGEILGGRLRMIQKRCSYRFSIDSLLLAHFATLRKGDDLIDLGTGSGIVALILASFYRCGRVLGIDIQEEIVTMAKRNVVMNGLEGYVDVRRGDVRRPESICAPMSFTVAVCNPPYRRLGSGRMNRDPGKALSRHEVGGTVGDFIAAAAHALREGGRMYAIYPATRMVELLSRMRISGIEPKRMQIVHSRPCGMGEFILLEGVKGGGEELSLLPPLFIYGEGSGYTAEMAAIFQGLSVFPSDDVG